MLLWITQARAEDIDTLEETQDSYIWQEIVAATPTWTQVYGTGG